LWMRGFADEPSYCHRRINYVSQSSYPRRDRSV
jgi:hypothetical protein